MGKKYIIDADTLTGIANAVRTKTGGSGMIRTTELASTISNLSTGKYGNLTVPGHESEVLDCSKFRTIILTINPVITNESTFLGNDLVIKVTAGNSTSTSTGNRTVTFNISSQHVEESGR